MSNKNIIRIIGSIISFVLCVIGGVDVLYRWLNVETWHIPWYGYVLFALALLIFICVFLFTSQSVRYWLYCRYRYYFTHNNKNTFVILEKYCKYSYLSCYMLKDEKYFSLKSKTSSLTSFADKFRWSGDDGTGVYDISVKGDYGTKVEYKRDKGNTYTYTVTFDTIGINKETSFTVITDKLDDSKKLAEPYLSSHIKHEKMRKLKLEVVFSDDIKDKIKKITYCRNETYSAMHPIFSEVWKQDDEKNKKFKFLKYKGNTVTVEENYPIYGYEYKLVWEIEEE